LYCCEKKNKLLQSNISTMIYENNLEWAQKMDAQDPLKVFQNEFHLPQHNGQRAIYFCGNSLGLQPKNTEGAIQKELDYWKNKGVEGWFTGDAPWLSYHQALSELAAPIVGAKPEEVILMNTLTVNLHLLMVSFYRPTKERYKIIIEGGAFPSDQYAFETQVRHHGFDPSVSIIEIVPREGEFTLRTEDIVQTIENEGNTVALILLSGVNYYTGQFYNIKKITEAAHRIGAYAGFDLAHAVGNVPLSLHDWQVDFAVWCTYKYLNSGPGGIGGAYIHEKHFQSKNNLHRFAGWWGHDEAERFKMEKGFIPMYGAAGWQVSTVQVIPSAMHKASLEVFKKAGGMSVLREKSLKLTGFLRFLLEKSSKNFKIITPLSSEEAGSVSDEHGCQLCILTDNEGKKLFNHLMENGVICDWREPNVIRLAPVPLYNSFEDVWRVGQLMG
jgi:kynureninase